MGLAGGVCRSDLFADVLGSRGAGRGGCRGRRVAARALFQRIPAGRAGLESGALGILAWPSPRETEKTSPRFPSDFINNRFWQDGRLGVGAVSAVGGALWEGSPPLP